MSTPHLRSTGCVEQTVKNKIKKMTFLHVYFGSLGVTKFSKSELYGWQVCVCVCPNKNMKELHLCFKTGPGWIVWWDCGTLYGLQSPEWG